MAAVFNKVWQLPRPDRRVRRVIDPECVPVGAGQRLSACNRSIGSANKPLSVYARRVLINPLL